MPNARGRREQSVLPLLTSQSESYIVPGNSVRHTRTFCGRKCYTSRCQAKARDLSGILHPPLITKQEREEHLVCNTFLTKCRLRIRNAYHIWHIKQPALVCVINRNNLTTMTLLHSPNHIVQHTNHHLGQQRKDSHKRNGQKRNRQLCSHGGLWIRVKIRKSMLIHGIATTCAPIHRHEAVGTVANAQNSKQHS